MRYLIPVLGAPYSESLRSTTLTCRNCESIPEGGYEKSVKYLPEINSWGYPKAVLFGFCVALLAYNVLAVVKAALRIVHGEDNIADELSGYYLAGHLQRTYDGMTIAIPEDEWCVFRKMSASRFIQTLQQLAGKVDLSKFRKHKRGPKKPRQECIRNPKQSHVSTARLIKNWNDTLKWLVILYPLNASFRFLYDEIIIKKPLNIVTYYLFNKKSKTENPYEKGMPAAFWPSSSSK